MGSSKEEIMVSGQRKVRELMAGFADSMALKCAIELGLPDIIHSHSPSPISLAQIAAGIDSSDPNMDYLERIMRFLVNKKIFSAHHPQDGGETLYGPTQNSTWLLRDSEPNLAPLVLMNLHPLLLSPWQCFAQCVKEGGSAFSKAHGCELFDLASQNQELNNVFFQGLGGIAKVVAKAILSHYGDGFKAIGSMVDVGGGSGKILAEIVKAYPHIKGTNFDLPHVVETAPTYDGVSHVAGSMFDAIPSADAVFMKGILHDWNDEYCIRILKNCRKAVSEKKTGRLIIVETVLKKDENNQFDGYELFLDLLMFAHTKGGKERTEVEWKKVLGEGGFRLNKIIKTQVLPSIIEAFPL